MRFFEVRRDVADDKVFARFREDKQRVCCQPAQKDTSVWIIDEGKGRWGWLNIVETQLSSFQIPR